MTKANPYPKHTFTHFAWNTYHLLVYQFGRYAIGAWVILVLVTTYNLYRQENLIRDNRQLILVTQQQAKENKKRIADIQESRIFSCIHTYRSIQQVLQPFYPPKKVRTPKQQAEVDKFERLIHNKQQDCRKQTRPK